MDSRTNTNYNYEAGRGRAHTHTRPLVRVVGVAHLGAEGAIRVGRLSISFKKTLFKFKNFKKKPTTTIKVFDKCVCARAGGGGARGSGKINAD